MVSPPSEPWDLFYLWLKLILVSLLSQLFLSLQVFSLSEISPEDFYLPLFALSPWVRFFMAFVLSRFCVLLTACYLYECKLPEGGDPNSVPGMNWYQYQLNEKMCEWFYLSPHIFVFPLLSLSPGELAPTNLARHCMVV